MKRLVLASVTALVLSLPLYAQNTPSSTTPATPDSSMDSNSSTSVPEMQQESSGNRKVHTKSTEVEMEEEVTPKDSSLNSDAMESEE